MEYDVYKDQTILRSISKSTQEHKFFERFLENDLEKLTEELTTRYKLIQEASVPGVTQ